MRRMRPFARVRTMSRPLFRRNTPTWDVLEDRTLLASDFDLGAFASAINARLHSIQTSFDGTVDALSNVPLLGSGLRDGVAPFRTVVDRLTAIGDQLTALGTQPAASVAAVVQTAIGRAFDPSTGALGRDWLGDTNGDRTPGQLGPGGDVVVTMPTTSQIQVRLLLHHSEAAAASLDSGLGFGLVKLSSNASIQGTVSLDYLLQVTFDAGTSLVTLDPTSLNSVDPRLPATPLALGLTLGFDGLSLSGGIGGIVRFSASNLPAGGSDPGTSFNGRFGLAIAQDGTVTPAFSGAINLGLHLDAEIRGIGLGLGADLVGHWGFSNAPAGQLGGGAGASLAFHNVTLDVGSVMHGLVQDVIDDVRKFTGPLEPLYRIASTDLPILGDVGMHVSLLSILDDKAKHGDGSAGQAVAGLRFIHLVNDVLPAADGSGTLNLGDFTLIAGSAPGLPFDVGAAAVPGGLSDGFNGLTGGLAATYESQGGFTFPFIQDPAGSVFKALVGRSDVDLFHFSSPEFHLHADIGFNVGVKGVAGVFFGGAFDFEGHIEGGYDLTGVEALIGGDNLGLLKGFYIDADPAKTYLRLQSFLGLSASVPLVTVSGGVHFDAHIGLDQSLRDPGGTRVRLSKLVARISENPLYAFEASGSIYAAASIDVGVDLGFGSVTLYHDDFARVELANFDAHYRPPGATSDGTDAGPSHIAYIHMTPGPDQVVVQPFLRHQDGFVDPRTLSVFFDVDVFGFDVMYADRVESIDSVVFDPRSGQVRFDANWIALLATDSASAGDDSIRIEPLKDERQRGAVALNLPMPNALLYGGQGNDTFVDDNPSIPAYMIGGDGNDYLGVTRSSLVLPDGTLYYYTPDQINAVRRAYGDSAEGFNPINNPELSVHRSFAGGRSYDFDLVFDPSTLPIIGQVFGTDYTGAGGNDTLVGMNVYGGPKNDTLIGTTVLQGGDGDDAITPFSYSAASIDSGAGLDTIIIDDLRSPLDPNQINLNLTVRGDGADTLIVHPYYKSVISATNRPPLNDNIRVSANRGALRVTSNGYSGFSIQATGLSSLNLAGFNHVAVEDTHGTSVGQILVDLPRQGASDVTLSGETSLNEARDPDNPKVVRVDRAGAGTGPDAPVVITEMRRDDTLWLTGGTGSNFYSVRYQPLTTLSPNNAAPFPPTDELLEDYFFKVQVVDLGKSGSLNGLLIDATPLANAYPRTSYTLRDGGLDVSTNAADPVASLVASTGWFLNGTPVTVVLPGSIAPPDFNTSPGRGVSSVTVNRTWDTAPATIDASQQDGRYLNGSLPWLVASNQGALTLLGSTGPDSFVVQGSSGNLKIDGQRGANQATLGASGHASDVRGTINLLAQGGTIDVNVDGSSFSGPRQAWVFAGFLFNILPATVYYDSATTSRLDVTDNGEDDLEVADVNAAATYFHLRGPGLKISAASKPLTVDVRSSIAPTVLIGGASGVRTIKGAVSVQGQPFHATIDDSAAALYNRPVGVVSVDGLGQTQVTNTANAPLTLGAGLLDLAVRTSPWNFSLSLLSTPTAPVNVDGPGAAVTIAGTGGPVSTHNTRRVTVGAGSLDAIRGPVVISAGDSAATTLVVDDSTDALAHAATLGASPIAQFGRVGGLSPATIDYATANVSALTFRASAASAESTLLVSDTNVPSTTIIGGVGPVRVAGTTNPLTIEGGASVTLGNGTLAALAGPILVRRDTTAGTILNRSLTIDDSADATARSAAVDVKQVVRNADYGLMAAQTNVTGLSPALIAYWPAQIGAVSILGGSGADTFDVKAVDATDNLTIVGGAGNDAFTAADLSKLRGPTTFLGGAGQDTLTLSDAAQTAGGTYTLTSTTVTVGTSPPVTFDPSMDFIDLTTGSGDDLVKILSTTDRYGDTAVHTGAGDDRIDVQTKSVSGLLHIDGGPGRNAVRIGSLSRSVADLAARAGNLDGLQGYVYVGHNDGGIDDLVIDDGGHAGGRGGLVFGLTALYGLGGGSVFYAPQSVSTITFYGGAGGNQFTVSGLYPAGTFNAGSGNDTVTVAAGPASRPQNLTINGQGGSDTLTVDDSARPDPYRYSLRGRTLVRTGVAPAVYYQQPLNVTVDGAVESLNVLTGTGDDTLTLGGVLDPTLSVVLDGGLGVNTLATSDSPAWWHVNGSDAGTLQNPGQSRIPVRFNRYGNLQGGTAADTFTIDPNGALSGSLAGGGGVDTLDYSTRTAEMPVLVNLWTGTATSIARGVSGFEVVNGGAGDDGILAGTAPVTINGGAGDDYIEGSAYDDVLSGGDGSDTILAGDGNDLVDGGAGDDLLEGGNGSDTLRGGNGRDVLIGGAGADDLQGGAGDDLLIGSDLLGLSDDDLGAILAEWTRTDASYTVRIGHLLNGGPGSLNGNTVIRPSNIPDAPNSNVSRDNAIDRLEGGAGQDWFIALPEDLIVDLATNERVNEAKP